MTEEPDYIKGFLTNPDDIADARDRGVISSEKARAAAQHVNNQRGSSSKLYEVDGQIVSGTQEEAIEAKKGVMDNYTRNIK